MIIDIFFDKQDRELLSNINNIIEHPIPFNEQHFFNANLHPHGIRNMTISREMHIAYAVVNLLTNFESGQAGDRVHALKSLYDEVLSSAHSTLRYNTARILLQLMKSIIQSKGDYSKQLMLIHDYRKAANGTPRVIRELLKKYYLPEMPEEWNQLSFDDHIYDAHSQGRKRPTHLIMDAWIKGIRNLNVVYNYYVDIYSADELLKAAHIMGIQVRLSIELQTMFREKKLCIIWTPHGFNSDSDLLQFFSSPQLSELSAKGKEVCDWQKNNILSSLKRWNDVQRPLLEKEWGTKISPLHEERLTSFMEDAHPSYIQLAECVHQHILPALQSYADILSAEENLEQQLINLSKVQELEELTPSTILKKWFPEAFQTENDDKNLPWMLKAGVTALFDELSQITTAYNSSLSLAGLTDRDFIEILYDSGCHITQLELYNSVDWHDGNMKESEKINTLQSVLNEGSGPYLKQEVMKIIQVLEQEKNIERAKKFKTILNAIPLIWKHYRETPLKTAIGSHSPRYSEKTYGMGFVYDETMPYKSQKALKQQSDFSGSIPIYTSLKENIAYTEKNKPVSNIIKTIRNIPGFRHFRQSVIRTWETAEDSRYSDHSNITPLGGIQEEEKINLLKKDNSKKRQILKFTYLNTKIMNWIKVLIGFIPSVASFLYTQDWWFLAWFGTFIWFAITGIRNIIQMIVAGNGRNRTSLLRWTDHISVSRICDSLMFTGISVALLEVIVRVWLLEDLLGYNVQEHPLIVFTVLNFVNAIYICSHNIYRGFPKEAAVGNLFRSALAIPVSSWYNSIFAYLLVCCGVADPLFYLVPSAAIISKLASDTVAAIIEGYADSQNNRRMRRWDYHGKLTEIFECYTSLELLFPGEEILFKLAKTDFQTETLSPEAKKLAQSLIIHALDLMFFWYYLPRSQDTLKIILKNEPRYGRLTFIRAQLLLLREHDISQLFVNGLFGRNFSRPLAFYLNKRKEYLHTMLQLFLLDNKDSHPKIKRNSFSNI